MSAHCALPTPDRMIYFVLVDYGYCRTTGKKIGLAWAERDPANMSWKETLIDIRSGELKNVVQVIEVNIAEFSSRDVTEEAFHDAGGFADA